MKVKHDTLPEYKVEQLDTHYSIRERQVTRGHNIVADGWARASNPHPHPNPPNTLKHTQKESKTLISHFSIR